MQDIHCISKIKLMGKNTVIILENSRSNWLKIKITPRASFSVIESGFRKGGGERGGRPYCWSARVEPRPWRPPPDQSCCRSETSPSSWLWNSQCVNSQHGPFHFCRYGNQIQPSGTEVRCKFTVAASRGLGGSGRTFPDNSFSDHWTNMHLETQENIFWFTSCKNVGTQFAFRKKRHVWLDTSQIHNSKPSTSMFTTQIYTRSYIVYTIFAKLHLSVHLVRVCPELIYYYCGDLLLLHCTIKFSQFKSNNADQSTISAFETLVNIAAISVEKIFVTKIVLIVLVHLFRSILMNHFYYEATCW